MIETINMISPFIYGIVAISCIYMISKGKDKLDTVKRIGYTNAIFIFAILIKMGL